MSNPMKSALLLLAIPSLLLAEPAPVAFDTLAADAILSKLQNLSLTKVQLDSMKLGGDRRKLTGFTQIKRISYGQKGIGFWYNPACSICVDPVH